jgi:predicted amidohydrolase
MRYREITPSIYALLVLLCSYITVAPLYADGDGLTVAGVQWHTDIEIFAGVSTFERHVESIIEKTVANYNPDIIVFPEYTNVFLALIPYIDILEKAQSYEEAMVLIRQREPAIRTVHELFNSRACDVERIMNSVWGSLARRWEVTIIAGTYFACTESESSRKHGTESTESLERPAEEHAVASKLTNRAVVFDANGEITYTQDKVYLTEFEKSILRLSPGSIEEVQPFSVGGATIGMSICRDTFFPIWEPLFEGALLWIDLKANGTRFTMQEQRRFTKALPARLERARVVYGLTVCLTGTFLDLMWEGESSLIRKGPKGVEIVERVADPRTQEILVHRLNLPP